MTSGREIRTFADVGAMSDAAARIIVDIAKASVAARGRFIFALAGGNTPRHTYDLLATTHRDAIDWSRTDVILGDERFVPEDDVRSNARMARESLVSRVPIPAARVHFAPTNAVNVEDAARQYESTLRRVIGPATTEAGGARPVTGETPTADVVMLGVGPDGHTASLFPGSPALTEQSRWVLGVPAPTTVQPAVPRITTTLPFLNAARTVLVLVSGADKRPVVREILNDGPSARRYPAALVAPLGRSLWLVDRSALDTGGGD